MRSKKFQQERILQKQPMPQRWSVRRRTVRFNVSTSMVYLILINMNLIQKLYETFAIYRCQCPAGYNGPRCQQTARSFRGNGWAWYPALEMCDNSHLSFEFITRKSDGLLLYNGPIVPPESDEIMVSGQ